MAQFDSFSKLSSTFAYTHRQQAHSISISFKRNPQLYSDAEVTDSSNYLRGDSLVKEGK